MKKQKQRMMKTTKQQIQIHKHTTMRLLVTFCLVILTVLSVDAQKKPKVGKAKNLWLNGEYAEAKEILDAAIEFEKVKDDGDTWYYRGLLYASLDTTTNESFSGLTENALEKAIEAFAKADELDDGKGYSLVTATTIATMDQQIAGYYNHYYTSAISNYENEDYASAAINFETASKIIKDDTTSLINAGYAAQIAEKEEQSIEYMKGALGRGAKAIGLYANMVNALLRLERKEEAIEYIREALEKYPSANEFKRQEISLLIGMGKAEEAKNELLGAIEKEPDDTALRFTLGLLYEELGELDKSMEAYNSALEVDPNHYESLFNKAVLIFNKANELYKEKAALGISKADLAKAKKLEPQINEGFKKALPAWEQVYKAHKPERPTLETLMFLYAYLDDEAKADKMEAELDALGEE